MERIFFSMLKITENIKIKLKETKHRIILCKKVLHLKLLLLEDMAQHFRAHNSFGCFVSVSLFFSKRFELNNPVVA